MQAFSGSQTVCILGSIPTGLSGGNMVGINLAMVVVKDESTIGRLAFLFIHELSKAVE